MKKWDLLQQVERPDGTKMTLNVRDQEYVIRVNGRELMSTRHYASEEQLAVVACEGLEKQRGVRVLVGGLGLGFTLRAALKSLGPDARVDVAELLPAVVEWNKNPSYPLASASLNDPRTHVVIGDVADVITKGRGGYDAIMLDADNETTDMNTAGNASLYRMDGLARVHAALRPGARVVYWAASEEPRFAKLMGTCGFQVEVRKARTHATSGGSHTLLIGRKT
jgi:spermidine synthase